MNDHDTLIEHGSNNDKNDALTIILMIEINIESNRKQNCN